MDYALTVALIVVMFLNFTKSIWITKVWNREQRIHSTQIYRFYEEIKRYNDNRILEKEKRQG